MLIRIRKAQSTLEYALLIGVVVGSLIAMQNYLKRSMMGRLRTVGDQMGDQYSPGLTWRNEQMHANAANIHEITHGGVNGNYRVQTFGGHQESCSEIRVEDLNQETW